MADRVPHHFFEKSPITFSMGLNDFVTGKSLVDFYFGTVSNANRLSAIPWYSDLIFKPGTVSTSAAFNKSLDEDFDLTFDRPVIIEGEALASIAWAVHNDEANTEDLHAYTIVTIKKLVGVAETTLVTATSVTRTYSMALDAVTADLFSVVLDIPKTSFKPGESLRVTVEIWQKSNGTTDIETVFCCDPKGRLTHPPSDLNIADWGDDSIKFDLTNVTGAVTTSIIQIPFIPKT